MRAFICVELPEKIRDILYDIQKQINHKNAKIKWVAKKNLHLTLKFFSEISSSKLEKVSEKLSEIKFKPFTVKLKEPGFFPSRDYIKIIWIGLENPVKILDLQGEIELKLNGLYPKDERFSAHLTLGRVKFIKDRDGLFESLNKIKVPDAEFEIREMTLMKSELTKDGPKYSVIKRF